MHDELRHDLQAAIAEMTDAEKRDLIHHLEQSLQANGEHPRSATARTEAEIVARQKRAWQELITHLADLPHDEPDDGLVASRDHDKILYDGTSHTGFPEKPRS